MRVSVKTKQIMAVTAIVFTAVALMGVFYLLSIAGILIHETRRRADALTNGIYTRAATLALEGGDLNETLPVDAGVRSIMEMTNLSDQAMYAAVVNPEGIAITHSDPAMTGKYIPAHPTLDTLVAAGPVAQLRTIFTRQGRTFEVRLPLKIENTEFGTITVAVSTLLIWGDLVDALRPALWTAGILVLVSVLVATLLAQWTLRPILLIRAGLARLGRGEEGVTLALPHEGEYGELGDSFNVVSARLAAGAPQPQAEGHLSRATVSKRLAALGRVSSGIAHEVKNPLNAMSIHLELLKMQINDLASGRPGATEEAREHVRVLAQQMRRLDDVVQGFLAFARPDTPSHAPVRMHELVRDMLPVISAEAAKTGVLVHVDCREDLPPVMGDAGQLHQAFLNLAINACQAMPQGGELRITVHRAEGRQMEVLIEDNGTGIAPENMDRIFNLFFTTKPEGSGVGLALVFRTIHLHDGDIEVQSVPDQGTTFRVTLPLADASDGVIIGK
ncbi:MAG TPA: ATP-binding protein [Vicinamibacterales bacterium]|nr:ATP-binding protein [Vicinamibacterales bacterium]